MNNMLTLVIWGKTIDFSSGGDHTRNIFYFAAELRRAD